MSFRDILSFEFQGGHQNKYTFDGVDKNMPIPFSYFTMSALKFLGLKPKSYLFPIKT